MSWIDELAEDHARAGLYTATTPHTSYPGGVLSWSGMAIARDPTPIATGSSTLLTLDEVEEIRETLIARGISFRATSLHLGVACNTLLAWLSKGECRRLINNNRLRMLRSFIAAN